MVRYPDTATIKVNTETKDVNGDIGTITTDTAIIGRFEPVPQNKSLDYAGKFYCKVLAFQPFEITGQRLVYDGVEFEIYQFQNYQNHCELWLK